MSEQFEEKVFAFFARQFENRISGNQREQFNDFFKKAKDYLGVEKFVEHVEDAVEAAHHNLKEAAKRSGIEIEITLGSLISEVGKLLDKEVYSKVNLFSSSTPSGSINTQHLIEQQDGIRKTDQTIKRIIEHGQGHPEKSKVVASWNSDLDFSRSSLASYPQYTKIIADPKNPNFMNLKAKHFTDAFMNRFILMENHFKQYFQTKGKTYSRSKGKAFVDQVLFGRVTLDSELEFQTDHIHFEFLDASDNLIECLLNFSGITGKTAQKFQLFPNQYLCVEVNGDLHEEGSSLKVKTIFELDDDLDAKDDLTALARRIDNHVSILVFKGPFNFSGTAYFGAFDMMKYHIKQERPSFIILVGPFVSSDQLQENVAVELETVDSIPEIRRFNIQRLVDMIEGEKLNIKIIIVPDLKEADNYYAVPIPPNQLDLKKVDLVSSPCLLAFNSVPIAIIPQDILLACNKFTPRNTEKRQIQTSRSLASQRNLHPAFPLEYPFDVTMIDQLSWDADNAPKVIVYSSQLTTFAAQTRGIISVNGKSVLEGDSFGHFTRILIEDSGNRHTEPAVRVDVVKF